MSVETIDIIGNKERMVAGVWKRRAQRDGGNPF